jgi:hypothetical protein
MSWWLSIALTLHLYGIPAALFGLFCGWLIWA